MRRHHLFAAVLAAALSRLGSHPAESDVHRHALSAPAVHRGVGGRRRGRRREDRREERHLHRRVARSIKGRCHYELVRMNIGVGQEWHPDVVFTHLVAGAPAVIFYNAEPAGGDLRQPRFFLQFSGDSGGAAPTRRGGRSPTSRSTATATFNGTTEELARLLLDVQAGKIEAAAGRSRRRSSPGRAMTSLPVWGKPVDPGEAAAPFVRHDPAKPRNARDAESPHGLARDSRSSTTKGRGRRCPTSSTLKPVATGGRRSGGPVEAQARGAVRAEVHRVHRHPARGRLPVPRQFRRRGEAVPRHRTSWSPATRCHARRKRAAKRRSRRASIRFTLVYFQNGGGATLELSVGRPRFAQAEGPGGRPVPPARSQCTQRRA